MRKIYFLVSLLCLAAVSRAQTAASYGFTPLTGTYSSIAGTGTLIPALSADDATEPSIPIGFTFTYCGVPYTSLSACTNGWISLSNSPSVEFNNSEFGIDGPGWIMPFWDDNDGTFTGTAFYQTTGTAPNRVFTIEWNSFESLIGIGDMNFQVKLYETSNIIDFCYGPSTVVFSDATIGISNDAVSDWQTLSDEGPAPTPLFAPTFENLIFSQPVDGQVYRWTPSCLLPAPITGTFETCPGGGMILSHDTLGGTWSSSTPAVGTISSTGIFTGISDGTTTVTYMAASGCYDTAIVTVVTPAAIAGTLTICEGLTTMLTHPTPGGIWSSGAATVADVTSVPGLIVGVAVGTASISYTLPSGCIVTAVVTVSPSVTDITGPDNICQGSTGTFSGTPAGGTWSSAFPGVASIVSGTGLATGLTGGTTLITYTLSSGCFRIAPLTVNPLPAPITGGSTICVSGTLDLDNTTAGGTWSSATPSIGTIDPSTGVFTGLSSGSVDVSYTLATGCYRIFTILVTTGVAPITGDLHICRWESTPLASATPGGTWSSSDVAVGTISTSGSFTAISAGTTEITYMLGSTCFANATMTVDPNEAIVGASTVCVGSTTAMTNPLAGGTWSSSAPGFFTVDAAGVVTGVAAGTGNVSYTTADGCVSTLTITVNPQPAVISGDLHICVGTTAALSSTPTGGTWSHTLGGAVTIDPVTGIVTGASVGVSNVTYTISTGCTRIASVTVDAAPAAIGGTATVCPNATTTLTHPVSGGTWSSGTPGNATVNASGVVTGVILAGGTATITYTLPSSGCQVTRVVTVLPAPAAIGGTLSVCVGANTTLTSSAGATWSSGNTAVGTIGASSGTLSGLTAGTTTIIATGTNGCTRSAVATVNPNPAAITGTFSVCEGQTTTLGNTTPGGTWVSSNTAVGTVSTFGGVVGGISANTVTITYRLFTGCAATQVVTVLALPAAFTPANTSVCIGSTVTLNSSPASGTWSSSIPANASVGATTGVVSGLAAGTTVISYTHPGNGCARTRTMTVNPLPAAIGGPTTVCPGSTITMTNTTPLGAWSSSNTAVGTIVSTTGALTGISGGTTTVTYTLPTSCFSTRDVTVIPAPIATITALSDTNLCPGDFVTLAGSAAVGATYIWYNSAAVIPGATSSTLTTGTSGSYQVRVSVAAGCSTLSTPMAVSVNPATATITVTGSTTACTGSTVALNANTGVGLTYQWLMGSTPIPGATTSTYLAGASGSYAVRVTNASGCWEVSAPVAVTITAAPSAGITLSGPLTFCSGNSVTITAASGTGYTYQWYGTPGAIPGATGMSFTATSAGTYYAEVTNASGCTVATPSSVVVVNPLPGVGITPGGPTVFCTGAAVSLTAAPGFSYQWYRGGAAIAGATSAGYVATTSGGYRVRVTNTTTGCTDMTHADTSVYVVDVVHVTPLTPAKFCWGGSAMLSTNVSTLGNRISYQWFRNGSVIAGATNGSYNASLAGNYSCTIAVPLSCTSSTEEIAVSTVPLPDPAISFTGSFLKTGNYYVTYQWYKNLLPIAGANTWTTPSTGPGNYKVQVTDTNGCQNMSATYVVTTPSTGVSNINTPDVRIYPNPATMNVHVDCSAAMRVVLTSIDGKSLIDVTNTADIDISKLADGMYIISVFDTENNLLKTEKLVKRSE